MTEAMRRSFCDRARYLGDPAFTKISSHLTTKEYAKKLAASMSRIMRRPLSLAKASRSATAKAMSDPSFRHRQGRHGRVKHLHAGKQLRLAHRCPRGRLHTQQRDDRFQHAARRHQSTRSDRHAAQPDRSG